MHRSIAVVSLFAFVACSKTESAPADSASLRLSRGEAQPTPSASPAAALATVKVYKDPNCGCCKEWVARMEEAGFKVETVDMPDLSAVKAKYGIGHDIEACHTAVVNGYVVEGHVPPDLIVKMINEKQAIKGLAVPGMPMGSPGMEGGPKQAYDVLSLDSAGHTAVYAHR